MEINTMRIIKDREVQNMKKTIIVLLCLAVLLISGCAKDPPFPTDPSTTTTHTTQATDNTQETEESVPDPTPSESSDPEPPIPETLPGTVLADQTAVILATAVRDSIIDVVGEYDNVFYIVKLEIGYGLIEKRLVRMNGTDTYELWNGYARYGAKLYNNYHLLSAEAQDLATNTQIQVLDSLEDCLVVQVGDTLGYMLESQISRSYIQPSTGSSNADGGDITLGYQGGIMRLSTVTPQTGDISAQATVLANGAEIILALFDRGETIAIINEDGFIEEKEDYYAVYLNGFCGYVWKNLVAEENAEPYTQWDGYAHYQAAVYDHYYLTGEPIDKLASNTIIHVICDLGECYQVSINEEIGYIAKEHVSKTYITYSGGNSSGEEWSDPVM
jgi:hypothetical protein